ncbi:MAG: hypothetical protein NWE81_01300 [Candidatus Bathyarchaeota archaeon]|nr:hypothetical protein [Candidatus Bathyarchaeota archaeon]
MNLRKPLALFTIVFVLTSIGLYTTLLNTVDTRAISTLTILESDGDRVFRPVGGGGDPVDGPGWPIPKVFQRSLP